MDLLPEEVFTPTTPGPDAEPPRTSSPVATPKKEVPVDMGFPEAVAAIMIGKKVTKREWNDNEEYCFINNEYLSIHHASGKVDAWLVREADLLGEDWVIV